MTNFNAALLDYSSPNAEMPIADNWFEAFRQLISVLKAKGPGRKVIFLDELPWMDTPRSGFVSALEYFWNSWASIRDDIFLVVCGSAASWMLNKLIMSKGGI